MAKPSVMAKESTDKSPATLGDVLYAKSKAPVSEQEWAALVQAIAAGDQLALHALYERAHRIVFTLIMRITANRETAEELTIDVFHDIWRRALRYDAAKRHCARLDHEPGALASDRPAALREPTEAQALR